MASFNDANDDTLSVWKQSAAIGASPDEAFGNWRTFVLGEIQRVMSGTINPGVFNSWPLRKAVRVGAPLETVRWLAAHSTRSANSEEALRYAVADPSSPKMVDAVLAGQPMPQSHIVLLWAALAGNWPVVRIQLELIEPSAREHIHHAQRIIDTVRIPAAELPAGFVVNPAVDVRYDLRGTMKMLWMSDDRDNYPTIHGLDVRVEGTPVPDGVDVNGPMSQWLSPADPAGNNYAENLASLLGQRFSDMRLLGSGAYGIVFASQDAARNERIAVKVSALANPTNMTPVGFSESVRDELRINLLLTHTTEYMRAFPMAVRVLDWTRGRIDLHAFVNRIGSPAEARSFLPGVGIYQMMVMQAFDLTLLQWQRSATGTEYARQHAITTVWMAMLLAQLLTLYRSFGMWHNDIKPDNIMLWNMATRPPTHIRGGYVVDAPVVGTRRLRVTPSQCGQVVPVLADFGRASVSRPVEIGRKMPGPNLDVDHLIGSLLSGVEPSWVATARMRLSASDMRSVTTEVKVLMLFATYPELDALLSK